MANKRMFSADIVMSDAFLDMGQGSQLLYFHLAMKADDDGFVNPKSIMRMLGIAEDDLKVLLVKRFLLPFESGVVVIKHWLIHNLIRADLYKETQYKKEKLMLGLNENGAYTELRDGVEEIKPIEPPKWLKERRKLQRTANVPQTALRIGKDRLDKVRGEGDTAPARKVFIKPTLSEVTEYCIERKNGINPQAFIDKNEAIGWKVGKNPMKDWKATIRTWENFRRENQKTTSGPVLHTSNDNALLEKLKAKKNK